MNRRKLLLGSGAILSTTLAGCSSDGASEDEGNGNGNGNSEDKNEFSDEDPAGLIPEVPDGWEPDSSGRLSVNTLDGADQGTYAHYLDPDGHEYRVEVIRWDTESDAESHEYTEGIGWTHHVVEERFSFAARVDGDPETNEAAMLLGHAPPLTAEQVREENKIE